MKNFRILSLALLGLMLTFSSCEQEEETNTPDGDCPTLSFTREGNSLVADFEGVDEIEFYGWRITGESLGEEAISENEGTSFEGDNKFDLTSLDAGTYTVCLVSESATCTQAEEFCEEIVITEEDLENGQSEEDEDQDEDEDGIENENDDENNDDNENGNTSCPDLNFTREGDLLVADFEGMNTLSFYGWRITGESLGQDTILENEGTSFDGDNKFDLTVLRAGTYTVCLVSESATCTQADEFCQEISVEGPANPTQASCDFGLVNPDDRVAVITGGFLDIDSSTVVWTIDGTAVERINGFTDHLLNLDAYVTDAAQYEVCYEAVSESCGTLQGCVTLNYAGK